MWDICVGHKRKMVALFAIVQCSVTRMWHCYNLDYFPQFCYKLLQQMAAVKIFSSVEVKLPIRFCPSNLFCYTCFCQPLSCFMNRRLQHCVLWNSCIDQHFTTLRLIFLFDFCYSNTNITSVCIWTVNFLSYMTHQYTVIILWKCWHFFFCVFVSIVYFLINGLICRRLA